MFTSSPSPDLEIIEPFTYYIDTDNNNTIVKLIGNNKKLYDEVKKERTTKWEKGKSTDIERLPIKFTIPQYGMGDGRGRYYYVSDNNEEYEIKELPEI